MNPKHTVLTSQRRPTAGERARGAEVVFERENTNGHIFSILGCRSYESWEQWGAPQAVLVDNCSTMDRWRRWLAY